MTCRMDDLWSGCILGQMAHGAGESRDASLEVFGYGEDAVCKLSRAADAAGVSLRIAVADGAGCACAKAHRRRENPAHVNKQVGVTV